jgi:hypothetical protein
MRISHFKEKRDSAKDAKNAKKTGMNWSGPVEAFTSPAQVFQGIGRQFACGARGRC